MTEAIMEIYAADRYSVYEKQERFLFAIMESVEGLRGREDL